MDFSFDYFLFLHSRDCCDCLVDKTEETGEKQKTFELTVLK